MYPQGKFFLPIPPQKGVLEAKDQLFLAKLWDAMQRELSSMNAGSQSLAEGLLAIHSLLDPWEKELTDIHKKEQDKSRSRLGWD